MNKHLLKLQRDIMDGAPKDCSPYNRYAYNGFSHTAQYLSHRVKTEDEKNLCMFLKDIAIRKSNELKAAEERAKEEMTEV